MKFKLVLGLWCLLLLSGCTFESWVISNLDYLITSRISKALSLNNREEGQVKKEVRKILDENKGQVKQVHEKLVGLDVKKVNVANELEFFGDFYFKMAQSATPLFAKKIANFDPYEHKKFMGKLKKENEKIREGNKKIEAKDYLSRYEFFFGDLSKEQKKLVTESMPVLKKLSKAMLAMREKTQQKMIDIRSKLKGVDRFTALKELFDKSSDRRKLDTDRLQLAANIQKLVGTLTTEQVKVFNKRRMRVLGWLNRYFETTYQ
jgi:hypothetical protein